MEWGKKKKKEMTLLVRLEKADKAGRREDSGGTGERCWDGTKKKKERCVLKGLGELKKGLTTNQEEKSN